LGIGPNPRSPVLAFRSPEFSISLSLFSNSHLINFRNNYKKLNESKIKTSSNTSIQLLNAKVSFRDPNANSFKIVIKHQNCRQTKKIRDDIFIEMFQNSPCNETFQKSKTPQMELKNTRNAFFKIRQFKNIFESILEPKAMKIQMKRPNDSSIQH
jgi:hypothetical protein